ncbi:MAG: J domain-containing protein [Candidatus Bathyarchaeota archaeon]
MFREDSIIARAKQVLNVEDYIESNVKKNFYSRIAKYHPDKHGSDTTEQAKVLIEAYDVLTSRAKPLECKLLEDDDLVASLLPKDMKPVKLGVRYEDWLKQNFYEFVKSD